MYVLFSGLPLGMGWQLTRVLWMDTVLCIAMGSSLRAHVYCGMVGAASPTRMAHPLQSRWLPVPRAADGVSVRAGRPALAAGAPVQCGAVVN